MNFIGYLTQPFMKLLCCSPRRITGLARESNLRIQTEFNQPNGSLNPAAPSTPQISIRTATETDPLLHGDDRSFTHNGLSPARSVSGESSPWRDRNSRPDSSELSRSRTSSKGSFEAGYLKDFLRPARIKCPHRPQYYFVPNSALDSLITIPNVEKEIRTRSRAFEDAEIMESARETCSVAKKVFAILAYMRLGPDICLLLRDNVSDQDLPLTLKLQDNGRSILERESGQPIKTFETWTDDEMEEFERIQWWMLTPVFEDMEHYELDDNTILPFIPFKKNAETKAKKEGAYSEVYAVRCHPAHHTFWDSPPSKEEEPLIAIKKLFSSEEKEFKKEETILRALGSKKNKHPHLIKLLATYKQETKYHLMFPYADANLRTYWENRPSPEFDEATVLWSLEQMAGIASGLNAVHNFHVTVRLSIDGPGNVRMRDDVKLSVVKDEELYGRHGDIKPENILWFQKCPETKDERGILQIADFGLGRFHGRDSRSKVPPDSVLGSPTYEPPECKLHRPVSRAYDIWSLGCLYLEFITWLLKGSAEIEGFSNFRGKSGKRSKEGLNDDYFFTLVKISNTVDDAVVREEVKVWVNRLHENEKCSQLIHELLDLIMKDVLLTDPGRRIPAKWLSHKLNKCVDKSKQDKDYLLRPVQWRHKLNNDDRSKSIPTILAASQDSKKVTFNSSGRPVPLTPAQSRPPRDLSQRTPPNTGLSRSKTHHHHTTWPISGSGDKIDGAP